MVSQRCLGILARVLLARQQKSLQAHKGMDIAECVTVWNRLINTLRDLSLQEEDVPVMQGMLKIDVNNGHEHGSHLQFYKLSKLDNVRTHWLSTLY